jgi:glycosyltransferase involved in cell wall biosynthesis
MRVLIDAHMLGEQEGGNETYIAGLLQGFEQLGTVPDLQISACFGSHYAPPAYSHIKKHFLRDVGAIRRILEDLPKLCRGEDVDILHVTYNAPLIQPCPVVVSVHDVIFRRYPAYFSPRVRFLLNTMLPLSMRRAKVILTLSEASKRDIIHYYPFTSNKVIVIGLAAGAVATVPPDMIMAQPYIEPGPYILAVGNVQPRKNIGRLIEAYLLARQRGMSGVRLLIVGRSQWQGSAIQRLATESPYFNDITFTGYLPDAVVGALYRRCSVFAYPSLYEGFGLPVLEAMACGAPTITSNCSSLPEVAGDAAILVDPLSVEQIASALGQVVANEPLQKVLRERGLQRAAGFSWEATARKTTQAYAQALT